MKINPKIALGAILILIITSSVTFLFLKNLNGGKVESFFLLSGQQNEFRLSLDLKESDKEKFESFVKNLAGISYPGKDVVFTLDSTGSASLAFKTPIKANINVEPKKLEIEGSLQSRLSHAQSSADRPKIPKGAELVIYAADLSPFFISRLNVDQSARDFLSEFIRPEAGTYLTSFRSGKQFALFFRQNLGLSAGSTNIPLESTQSATGNVKFYKFKFPQLSPGSLFDEPVIFESDGFFTITSTQETADLLLSTKDFIQNAENYDLTIDFSPKDDFDSEKFTKFISSDGLYNEIFKKNFQNSLNNIREFKFSLKGIHFSALINLK